MKTVSFILILAGLALQVNAQLSLSRGFNAMPNDTGFQKKVDYSLSTGTSFFSSPGFASGSSFFLAPEFKMKLSPKFKVDAGIMLMQNRLNASMPTSIFGEKSVVVKSGPSYGGIVYASGNYQLNARLVFSGSFEKSFSPDGYSQMGLQNSYQTMSLGVKYKLSEHMSISGGFRVLQTNGFNPYSGYNYLMPGTGLHSLNSFADPF